MEEPINQENTENIENQITKSEITVDKLLVEKAKNETDVKNVIDLLATSEALKDERTIDKLIKAKGSELEHNAETKENAAESEKLKSEADKIKAEKQKVIEAFDKQIEGLRKEAEQLKAEADKEKAFFEKNKDIFRYICITSPKSLKVMQGLLFFASIIFTIIQVLVFPITLVGIVAEKILDILGDICKKISSKAIGIIVSILVGVVIFAAIFLFYYYGIDLFKEIF